MFFLPPACAGLLQFWLATVSSYLLRGESTLSVEVAGDCAQMAGPDVGMGSSCDWGSSGNPLLKAKLLVVGEAGSLFWQPHGGS